MASVRFESSAQLDLICPSLANSREAERIASLAGDLSNICFTAYWQEWDFSKLCKKVILEISHYELGIKYKIVNYLYERQLLSFKGKEKLFHVIQQLEAMKASLNHSICSIRFRRNLCAEEMHRFALTEAQRNDIPAELQKFIANELMKDQRYRGEKRAIPWLPGKKSVSSIQPSKAMISISKAVTILTHALIQNWRRPTSFFKLCRIVLSPLQAMGLPLRSKRFVLCELEEMMLLSEAEIDQLNTILDWIHGAQARLESMLKETLSDGIFTKDTLSEEVLSELQKCPFPKNIQAFVLDAWVKEMGEYALSAEQKRRVFLHSLLSDFIGNSVSFLEQQQILNSLIAERALTHMDKIEFQDILMNFAQEKRSLLYQCNKNLTELRCPIETFVNRISKVLIENQIPKYQLSLLLSALQQDGILSEQIASKICSQLNCFFTIRADILRLCQEMVIEGVNRRQIDFEKMIDSHIASRSNSKGGFNEYQRAMKSRLFIEISDYYISISVP